MKFKLSKIKFTQSFKQKETTSNFSQKISVLGTFGGEFEETIAIFKISTPDFFNMQSLMQK